MPVGFALRQSRSTNTLSNCVPIRADAHAMRLVRVGEGFRGALISRPPWHNTPYHLMYAEMYVIAPRERGARGSLAMLYDRVPRYLMSMSWQDWMIGTCFGGLEHSQETTKRGCIASCENPILVWFGFAQHRLDWPVRARRRAPTTGKASML